MHRPIALLLCVIVCPLASLATTINNESAFLITPDGQFTSPQEWSDVTPVPFISNSDGTLTPTTPGNPAANSLLYGALAPGLNTVGSSELYIMYDYAGRTNSTYASGDVVASIAFTLKDSSNNPEHIHVEFIANGAPGPNFYNVSVNLDSTPGDDMLDPNLFNLDAAASFGSSPNFAATHLMIELEADLKIPANFGPAFPTAGLDPANGVGYSPDPSFWRADALDNNGDPPISSAIFQLTPTGQTIITPLHIIGPVAALPIPSSACAGALLLTLLLASRFPRPLLLRHSGIRR